MCLYKVKLLEGFYVGTAIRNWNFLFKILGVLLEDEIQHDVFRENVAPYAYSEWGN
jgi:hypothetical protein